MDATANSDAFHAYAAGFFDGEGCVIIVLNRARSLTCQLVVVNTNRAVLDDLQAAYGGAVKARTKAPSHQLPQFNWNICGEESEAFAHAILPHSRVKRDQLELYLHARTLLRKKGRQTGPITEDELAARRAISTQSSALKRVAS